MPPKVEILLVDDNPNDIFVLQMALEDLAFDAILHCRNNGASALEFIKNHPVDIIVTDLNMPIMSGLKLIQSLKTSKSSQIPVIFLTASNSQDDINEAYKNNCAFYINKPLNKAELTSLVNFINVWVKKVRLPERVRQENDLNDL